jgi:acyl-coenzyme A synthetase/AMP-(fatty) acid ligase
MLVKGYKEGLVLQVLWRDSLPRTASNKVMRRLLRDELRSQSRL